MMQNIRRSRLFLILVSYNEARTLNSLRFINDTFDFIDNEHKVVVFNSDVSESKLIRDHVHNWIQLKGSNTNYEFSGWQEGLDYIRFENNSKCDGVIFLNDTVVDHRVFSPARRIAFVSAIREARMCSLIGFANKLKFKEKFSIETYEGYCWISTYMYFLDIMAIRQLDWNVLSSNLIKPCINAGVSEDTFFSRSISANLREHLVWWLFGGGWYKSEVLTEKNSSFFRAKALCIINEKLLSLRATKLGIEITDAFKGRLFLRKMDSAYVNIIKMLAKS